MSVTKISCPVCLDDYNQTNRIPRILPSCGHSVCLGCLRTLTSGRSTFRCPFDRQVIPLPPSGLDCFPINYALQTILSEHNSCDTCEHHGEEKRLICVDDLCLVCEECVFSGSHRGHEIKALSKIGAGI